MQEAYGTLKAEVESLWPDIEEITWKSFIGYRENGKRLFFFHIHKYKMSIHISEDIDSKTVDIIKSNNSSRYVEIENESDIAKGINVLHEINKALA